MDYERPALRCLVSFPIEEDPDWFTEAAVVGLETAAELKTRGYMVLVDPSDERELAMWERLQRATQPSKKWLER